MAREFLISDTHFNHTNIIKYSNRPFYDVHNMNASLIQLWNDTVDKYDLVYHLGDFAFGNKDNIRDILHHLNGSIILILGNHDRQSLAWWKDMPVLTVVPGPILINGFLLSHRPVMDSIYSNIHGHVHNKSTPELREPYHYNVSVEVINYRPILFEEIVERQCLSCDEKE